MATQPFYNTGTAVLTNGSTAMVGTGTLWLGNIRAYDRVVGKDGKEAIVASVTDNTHIVLARPWQGTTQATDVYEIWMSPDEIFLQTLARQIFETLKSSTLTALSTLTPIANTLIAFDSGANAVLSAVTDFARVAVANIFSQKQTISLNTGALPTVPAGTGLQIGGVDGTTARIVIDSFGTPISSALTMRSARGTAVAPSALQSGDQIANFGAFGYGLSAYSASLRAGFLAYATENWSNTAHGTKIEIQTTPNGSTTARTVAKFDQDGSLTITGNATVNGDMIINANAAALPAPSGGTGTVLQIGNADGLVTQFLIDAFGNVGIAPQLAMRHARGTAVARTALQNGDQLFNFVGLGYGASAYGPGSIAILGQASENWSNTAQGGGFTFFTTANGTASLRQVAALDQAGNFALTVGQLQIGKMDGTSANVNPAVVLGKRPSGSSETIGISDGAGAYIANLGYNLTAGCWSFRVGDIATDDFLIDANGIPLFGGQIKFPATQNPSSNATTLDDYEEGTFTPTIVGETTAGAGTYSVQQGRYTKIGNVVTVTADITWSAHTGTGNTLVGLPFTIAAAPAPKLTPLLGSYTFTGVPVLEGVPSTNLSRLYAQATGAAKAAIAIDTAASLGYGGVIHV